MAKKVTMPLWGPYSKKYMGISRRVDSLTARERKSLLHSKRDVPGEWLTCNGFLLPDNYVDVARYEQIFQTHNRFRAFCSAGRSKDAEVADRMADSRGVQLEDLEAREICSGLSVSLFGSRDVRRLGIPQRLRLAGKMRSDYRISFRQLGTLVHLPEMEIRKYVR